MKKMMTFKRLPIGAFFVITREASFSSGITLMKKTRDSKGKECYRSMLNGAIFNARHTKCAYVEPSTQVTHICFKPHIVALFKE
ncbi:MAG: hypothetical protein Q8N88_04235 [Nanoarchaeota archaeon]|nr:hypothetical protein [Nanoarchaeota archaeon]